MSKTIALIVSLVMLSAVLNAQTYYLSATGNDTASGTSPDSAWKSIEKLNSMSLSPGTTVLFEGGQTFSGSILVDQDDANDKDNLLTFASYGNSRAIIKSDTAEGFYAYNTQGITLSDLIFEGAGSTAGYADGVLFYTDLEQGTRPAKITLRRIEVRKYGGTGIVFEAASASNTGFKHVLIDEVHVHHVRQDGIVTRSFTMHSHSGWAHENITIRNSEVDNVSGYAEQESHSGSGIILAQVNGGLIEKCAAHHNGAANTHCGGPGGIWAWDCNNITIQYCESYSNSSGTGCDGLGFDLDGGVTNSVLQYNYSHDNDGPGYLLGQYEYARPWSNNVVRYNVSENDGRSNGGGFTLFKGPETTMSGCRIYNNTVYMTPSPGNSGAGCFTIIDWYDGISDLEVYNNIFQATGGAYLIDAPGDHSAKFAGNLYWPTGATFKINYQDIMYGDLNSWRNATGNERLGTVHTGVTANPFLANAGAGITLFPALPMQLNGYQLSSGSAAVDAGLDLALVFGIHTGTVDFFGNPVKSGTTTDIGAHEYKGGMTTSLAAFASPEDVITCYPNPVPAGNTLHIKGMIAPFTGELFSAEGALLRNVHVETDAFTMPGDLPIGLYILRAYDHSGRMKTTKIIVE